MPAPTPLVARLRSTYYEKLVTPAGGEPCPRGLGQVRAEYGDPAYVFCRTNDPNLAQGRCYFPYDAYDTASATCVTPTVGDVSGVLVKRKKTFKS